MNGQTSPIYIVELSSPCEKQWNELSVLSHNTGHCQSCDKVLTNFSEMSDTELLNWFKANPSQDNLCGFWHKSQLGRPIFIQEQSSDSCHPLKSLVFSLLMFLGVLNSHGQNTTVVDSSAKTEQLDSIKSEKKDFRNFNKNTRSGRVKIDYDRLLRGPATIKIKETGDSIVSDTFGHFYFELPNNKRIKRLTFAITYKHIQDTIILKTNLIESYTEFNIVPKRKGIILRSGGTKINKMEENKLLFELWMKGRW